MKVCVFAGARGNADLCRDAEWIGAELARRGHHVYFGGSSKGPMGALYRGVNSQGGNITGILPKSIAALNHYPPAMDKLITDDMPSRKAIMWTCDAFLCLPGAYGSMDELFEILTHVKLGHEKYRPVVVYNQTVYDNASGYYGFYDGLDQQISVMVSQGTMDEDRAKLVQFISSKGRAVDAIESMASQGVAAAESSTRQTGMGE